MNFVAQATDKFKLQVHDYVLPNLTNGFLPEGIVAFRMNDQMFIKQANQLIQKRFPIKSNNLKIMINGDTTNDEEMILNTTTNEIVHCRTFDDDYKMEVRCVLEVIQKYTFLFKVLHL
ncbi:hypothetical protein GJ496_011613 [Pomphorhynchus laevis]|nr:hypothetical protein GJ496_011613 [Pomphorhynchus laevis]